jgi:hypothetical protein
LYQVYSPPQHDAYDSSYFPGIVDAIALAKRAATLSTKQQEAAWADVQHEVHRVARALDRVTNVLSGSVL